MEKNDVELSLVETLKNSELSSLAAEYGELGLDQFFDDGLLKEIPVIGTIKKLLNIGVTVHEYLFAKKLLRFLIGLSQIPQEQRQKQIDRLAENPKERQRVGEAIMLLLDKANDMTKPAMMASAFRAYVLEEIDVASLWRIWHAIDVVDVSCIPELTQVYQNEGQSDRGGTGILPASPEFHHLAICGLLTFEFGGMRSPPPDSRGTRNPDGSVTSTVAIFEKAGFKRSALGRLFVDKVCR